jgi:hypothetical protein
MFSLVPQVADWASNSEIERMTKLRREQLDVLVNARLLRADQRADSAYFELSHDSLVHPIRASRLVWRSASARSCSMRGLSVGTGMGLGGSRNQRRQALTDNDRNARCPEQW